MPKLMLINVTHSEESRVGIINNGVLESFEIESLSREHLKGNIYKGVIHRIHPALEAAFVDIGAERDAFLPLDEICFRNLPNVPAQAVDEHGKKQRRRIRDLLKPGGEILVQIAKEQFANKPPTLTTFYSLPGRYLVLLTGSDETGISRRIEGEERQRLRQLVTDLNPPEGFGLIVRTAAGLDEETGELANDLNYLLRLWDSVQEAASHKRGPALVYREQDIVLRTIRDLFTPDIDEIHIDNEDVYLRAREFLRNVMPGKEHVLHCYRGEQPIFSAFDVSQIETVFKRRVPLTGARSSSTAPRR
jgi:ribonuclease E